MARSMVARVPVRRVELRHYSTSCAEVLRPYYMTEIILSAEARDPRLRGDKPEKSVPTPFRLFEKAVWLFVKAPDFSPRSDN